MMNNIRMFFDIKKEENKVKIWCKMDELTD